MRAIVIKSPGPEGQLSVEELASPPLLDGQVLVRVRAAGVCHRDVLDRLGRYPFIKRPVVTGHEFAGEIVEVGAGVGEWKPGDRVANTHRAPCGHCAPCRAGDETWCVGSLRSFGLTVDGGYAELVAADAGALVRVPDELPLERAAFLHCTAEVALRALRSRAGVRQGETVVVTGASGGVGMHAIQVARILGCKPIAITSHAAKADALARAGAEVVVEKGPFHRAVLDRTGGGADVVLDLVGEPTFNASLRSLRTGGRLVVVGNVTAARVELNPGWVIMREVAILGSSGASRADLAEVLGWAASGQLQPVVADVLPLERAAEAQARLVEQSVVGRIVLAP